MRKPPLTKKMAGSLRALAGYAEAESDMLSDGDEEQVRRMNEIQSACNWLRDLCAWHSFKSNKQQVKQPPARD